MAGRSLTSLKKGLGIVASVAFVAWCVHYASTDPTLLATARSTRWEFLTLAMLFQLLVIVINGANLRRVMRTFSIQLRSLEAQHISTLTTAGNNFLPMNSGMAMRAIYLKRAHNFEFSQFVAISAGTYVLNYLIVCIYGLASAVAISYGQDSVPLAPTAFFAAGSLGLLVVVFGPNWNPRLPFKWGPVLNRVIDSWHLIRKDRGLLIAIFWVSILNLLATTGLIYVSLLAVVPGIPLLPLFLLTALDSLTLFIRFTPGNLGVTEGLLIYGGHLIHVPPESMLVASAFMRLSMVLLLIPLTPIALYGLSPDGK
jgi:uncharacterized membrane protein YbhN (UPF0104 family)